MRRLIVTDAILGGLSRALAVLVALFLLAPLVVVFATSFNARAVAFPPSDWSLAAYTTIPDQAFRTFSTSLLLGLASAVVSVVLCVPAAMALVRGRLPGRSAIETVFRSPLQLPPIVLGIAFLQYFLYWQNLTEIKALGTFWGLLVAHVLIVSPYVLVAVIARLSTLDPRLEEAAAGLGAGTLMTQVRVVLPLLRPSILAGMFMAFVMSFEDVAVTLFLVGADTTTFPVYLFGSAQVSNTPSLYAASSLGAVVAMALALVVQRVVGLRTVLSR
ncbi:ABC transporter permease [Jiangella asiatica]|uniref:ABC transporter permease n=1 Tax=Jiangella asiatica TaxID=2530372 RepID=A0A4R5DTU0_9ACTN|nr:ABC transporter permease [Jiangella asiatica]TDE15854.1 ABC transporter permease [Jiangella asiatica]